MSQASPPTLSYVFVAAELGGRKRFGVRRASGARALSEGLRRERLLLLRSYELPKWLGAGPVRRLKLADTLTLNLVLGQLLGRGVPLVEALEVAGETVSAPAKSIVARMREQVAAGSSFADACLRAGVFDRVTVAVYRAAERTGDLAGAAEQLAVTARRNKMVQDKATTLMIYPLIVLALSAMVVAAMLMVIVPAIGRSLLQLRVELPGVSKLLISTGMWMQTNWIGVVIGVLGLIAAAILARAWLGGLFKRVIRRLPAVRDVILAQESTRFFSTMAAMTRSGVPLADALGVANEAVGLPLLREQLETLRTRLIEGGVLRNLIEQVDQLPISTRRLLIAAERSGDMEAAFDALSSDMADETDRRAQRLLAILGPLLIVLMFLIIGTVLIAIYIPMFQVAGSAR